jgi:hypothetical protein
MHLLLNFAYAHSGELFVAVGLAYVAYLVSLVTHRLLLSPLKSYPGPGLAAATSYYQFWYDVVQGGGKLEHLENLHERYGA